MALRRDIGRILAHDPLVRQRAEFDDGDTAVHQMRVGCRRLRSNLRNFELLLDTEWSGALDVEVSWVADALGGVRDIEVLRARLPRTVAADPLAPLRAADVDLMDGLLVSREAVAWDVLDAALASERYVALLDLMVKSAAEPPLSATAGTSGAKALLRMTAKPWRRLKRAVADLDPEADNQVWHRARIRAKHARYAVEAVAEAFGRPAVRLGRALAKVQDNLGEHQDAVVAVEAWLSLAATDPARLGVTAGRLVERERASVRAARAALPGLWRATSRNKRIRWLGRR